MIEHDIDVGNLGIHFYESGRADGATLLLLHGWPQSARCWFDVMAHMKDLRVLAPDLPGIGASVGRPLKGDKRHLAGLLVQAVDRLGIGRFSVAGHDVGGMIAYALMRMQPSRVDCGTIVNVSIPGVEPWSRVVANPDVWHFGFHRVPDLPEILVADHIGTYFDFFYDALSGRTDNVPAKNKQAHCLAYSRQEALSTGFDWYRAFPEDAKANASDNEPCAVPLLYVRSSSGHGRVQGDMDAHVRGFKEAGLSNVGTAVIPDAGHFVPEERPAELAEALARFVAAWG